LLHAKRDGDRSAMRHHKGDRRYYMQKLDPFV
jgi:hypothetical protein